MSRLHRTLLLTIVVSALLIALPLALGTSATEPEKPTVKASAVPAATTRPPILAPSTLVLLGLGLVGLAICHARLKQHR